MNNSIFNSYRFKKGETVYYPPIRFWENKDVLTAEVLEDTPEDSECIYVYAREYGHPVYMTREFVCTSSENCVRVIETLNKLYEIMHDDIRIQIHRMVDKILKDKRAE